MIDVKKWPINDDTVEGVIRILNEKIPPIYPSIAMIMEEFGKDPNHTELNVKVTQHLARLQKVGNVVMDFKHNGYKVTDD